MKYLRWAVAALMWTLIIGFGLMLAEGVSEGSYGWALAAVFGFAYMQQVTANKVDRLEMRIARLEKGPQGNL